MKETRVKLSSGVQALEITIGDLDHAVVGIVTREALETFGDTGPMQGDLLVTYTRHTEEIVEAVLARARETGRRVVAITGPE